MLQPQFTAYDPSWLVSAAQKQFPDQTELHAALSRCTRACNESEFYIRFVDASRANQPISLWQFSHNLILEDALHGEVVLDVLKSGAIGGVEFLSLHSTIGG